MLYLHAPGQDVEADVGCASAHADACVKGVGGRGGEAMHLMPPTCSSSKNALSRRSTSGDEAAAVGVGLLMDEEELLQMAECG